jgi:hypothetical protein
VVACSARWAISGIGIGVIVLAAPCADWTAVAAGPPAGCGRHEADQQGKRAASMRSSDDARAPHARGLQPPLPPTDRFAYTCHHRTNAAIAAIDGITLPAGISTTPGLSATRSIPFADYRLRHQS